MKKKKLAALLICAMIISVTGCTNGGSASGNADAGTNTESVVDLCDDHFCDGVYEWGIGFRKCRCGNEYGKRC